MMKPTRIAVLCLAGVFGAGAVFGFLAHSVYSQRVTRAASPSPKEFRGQYINRLEKRLSLTPDQRDRVAAILDETGDRFRDLRERIDPEFDRIRQEQRQKVTAILSPEQQAEYQVIIEEQQRRRREQGHRR
jgi:Spy/CpxP family protein refolding chaperone